MDGGVEGRKRWSRNEEGMEWMEWNGETWMDGQKEGMNIQELPVDQEWNGMDGVNGRNGVGNREAVLNVFFGRSAFHADLSAAY